MTKIVHVSTKSMPSVADFEPMDIHFDDNKPITVRCPKIGTWNKAIVSAYVLEGLEVADAAPEDIRDAQAAIRQFFVEALGGERAYARFNRAYDQHHLVIAFTCMRTAWADDIAELEKAASAITKKVITDLT